LLIYHGSGSYSDFSRVHLKMPFNRKFLNLSPAFHLKSAKGPYEHW